MLILKIFMLIALIKILLATDKPFLCAGLYTGVIFVLGLAFGNPIEVMLIAAVISFVLASVYFWLLSRFEDSGFVWWLILIAGLLLGVV